MIGGDFNLLPSESAYNRLMESEKKSYRSETEITAIYKLYRGIPSFEAVNRPGYRRWFTHFPNRADLMNPDRTLDYIFISNDIQLGAHYVRQKDTINISDHFPVIVEAKMP
jgi:endonuclease/exonuclease/phosphatase family metal-dependent hydrolase